MQGKNKPICIDLFCGLGGWAEGFLAEGYDVVGFDIERHDYGTGGYPGLARAFNSTAEQRLRDGQKFAGFNFHQYEKTGKPGGSFQTASVKGSNGGWFNDNKRDGKDSETGYLSQSGSKSPARKAASAQIAKIPFPLANHIARVFKPIPRECEGVR